MYVESDRPGHREYPFMRPLSGPRLYIHPLIVACAVPLLFALHGCESEADQRLARARELARRQQEAQTASIHAQPKPNSAPVSPDAPPAQAAATPAADAGLPIYPNARKLSTGPGSDLGMEDGLSMAMLET